MNNSRGGFFSLNRLLGRKNKNEKNLSENLSKSSIQTLTRSTTNLEEISPQNKITPLAVIPNAPFEQSFRITVYLPFGQLYVARIGAKTKLSELLKTICMNKSLEPNKFEFQHPVDETQIFDLNFTIGEVGLNEIKLVPKNQKHEVTVKYRMHSKNNENRPNIRPHTISSVSPYSSMNSLNSSDSSGIMMNQRLNNSNIPSAPSRKKRVAPRPPSQNSIPENPEAKYSLNHISSFKSSNLAHQNFHVSSPNLAANNSVFQKSHSNQNANIEYIIDHSHIQNGNANNSKRKTLPNRPLSIQFRETTSEHYEIKSENYEKENVFLGQNHSRTSSETSDITRDNSLPEPQPRKRPPIGKKKAPAPPPRTISAISNSSPKTNPKNMKNLSEGSTTPQNEYSCSDVSKDQTCAKDGTPNVPQDKRTENVSKVMLNVKIKNEAPGDVEEVACETSSRMKKMSAINESSSVSKTKLTYLLADETFDSHSSSLKGNSCDINSPNDSLNSHRMNIDHDDISKQVNEIIDEAAKINENKLNAENNRKNKESAEYLEEIVEINNNNNPNETSNHNDYEKYSKCNQRECEFSIKNQKIDTDRHQVNSTEAPIQPILNETRTFNFHECSENSLPTSTTSTLNTMETPSTGPESLITSDIEDGYKGNEVEKKRKIEFMNPEDSKEDFIESQFEFLQEHLDKTNIDPDEEKTFDFNKKSNLISSTMIADKINETYDVAPSLDKTDVINELTHIISCNRLETFIKPNNEINSSVESSKRSSLSNFHISAYSNTIQKKDKSNISDNNYSVKWHSSELGKKEIIELPNTIRNSQSIPLETVENDIQGETFTIPKNIGRSMSFQSTNTLDQESLNSTMELAVSSSERRNSYLSLNKTPEPETHKRMIGTNHQMIPKSEQKSSSELTIRDTPSLQSIEVMKLILNKSNLDWTTDIPKSSIVEKKATEEDIKKKPEEKLEKSDANGTKKPETSESFKVQQAYKYQGPPAINFSTWGERPKSMVHIKSDSDYIFGGTSKIAALQRRLNGDSNESIISGSVTSTEKNEKHCERISCKLPIVRGVEYKKNIEHTNIQTIDGDVADSTHTKTPLRSSYEISRIVSETPLYMNTSYTNKNNVDKSTHSKNKSPKSFQNNYSGVVQRVQSFNSLIENRSINQYKGAKEKVGTKEPKKPIFNQYALKKTGLKEKMFNTSYSDPSDSFGTERIENEPKNDGAKINPIPTAPKPPLIFKKTGTRSISMGDVQPDPRNQLLDSIRNFNRETLKRKGIH